jgi:GNAT superfamily N-acetyltransferase
MKHLNETVTYLEMTAAADLLPARHPAGEIEVRQAEIPCPELNRYFYTAIGGDWYWIDRLPWTYEQWLCQIARRGYETWVAYLRGTPIGYFELDVDGNGDVEIAYFGVLPHFSGQGIGGHLLTTAIRRAWAKRPSRVWLHTSSFDHPRALGNYLARGFRVVKTETFAKEIPEQPPGAWPGANR